MLISDALHQKLRFSDFLLRTVRDLNLLVTNFRDPSMEPRADKTVPSIWRETFAHWPAKFRRKGVIEPFQGDPIPFVDFVMNDDVLILERATPDNSGARRVVMPFHNIGLLKYTEPLKTEAFLLAGYVKGGETPPPKPKTKKVPIKPVTAGEPNPPEKKPAAEPPPTPVNPDAIPLPAPAAAPQAMPSPTGAPQQPVPGQQPAPQFAQGHPQPPQQQPVPGAIPQSAPQPVHPAAVPQAQPAAPYPQQPPQAVPQAMPQQPPNNGLPPLPPNPSVPIPPQTPTH